MALSFDLCNSKVELLGHKCIRDKDTNEILMRVVEEPVTRHLPVNSRVVGERCILLFKVLSLVTRTNIPAVLVLQVSLIVQKSWLTLMNMLILAVMN